MGQAFHDKTIDQFDIPNENKDAKHNYVESGNPS